MLSHSSHKMMLHLSRNLHNFNKVEEINICSKNINDIIVKVIFKNWSYLPLSRIVVGLTATNALLTKQYLILLFTDKLQQSLLFSAFKHFD